MDLIDKMILEELKKDSRLTMSELGRRVHLSSCLLQNKSADLCKEFVQSPALFLCIKKDLPATPSPSTV